MLSEKLHAKGMRRLSWNGFASVLNAEGTASTPWQVYMFKQTCKHMYTISLRKAMCVQTKQARWGLLNISKIIHKHMHQTNNTLPTLTLRLSTSARPHSGKGSVCAHWIFGCNLLIRKGFKIWKCYLPHSVRKRSWKLWDYFPTFRHTDTLFATC